MEQSIIIQTIHSKKNIIKYISVPVMDFQKTAIGYDGIAMATNHWSNDQLVFKQSFMPYTSNLMIQTLSQT